VEDQDLENILIIELASGRVVMDLYDEIAPQNVARVKELARAGEYDNVAFHRVIDGFVAQGGDVQYGDVTDGYDPFLVGTGNSDQPDLPAEFSDVPFERGVVGMARSSDPNSANSQFFIMFDDGFFLNGAYTAIGEVTEGMELVDQITRVDRDPQTGLVVNDDGQVIFPDAMLSVDVAVDLLGLGLTQEEAEEVALIYEAGLDRDGDIDLPGYNFWIDQREAGLSSLETAGYFLNSDEFQENVEAFLGDGTDITDDNVRDADVFSDDDFVIFLYENVLDRTFDQPGFEFWSRILDGLLADPDQAGTAREQMLLFFADSGENRNNSLFVETATETFPGEWAFVDVA